MKRTLVPIAVLLLAGSWAFPTKDEEKDDISSRKILGSSVVTSVSVIMDSGAETQFSDAVGKPVSKPLAGSQVASPINLLNPDRYEFYTFDDNGDLVKRLMTLQEIQSIIANGDGDAFNYSQLSYNPENKVNDVVHNVQNVLKEEIKSHQNGSVKRPIFDTPDVSSSWSMILPAIFGNSGEQIQPNKPPASVTAETIMVTAPPPIVQKPKPFKSTKPSTEAPITSFTIINNKPSTENNYNKQTTVTTKKPTTINRVVFNNNVEETKVASKKPVRPSTFRPSTYKIPTKTSPTNSTTLKPTTKLTQTTYISSSIPMSSITKIISPTTTKSTTVAPKLTTEAVQLSTEETTKLSTSRITTSTTQIPTTPRILQSSKNPTFEGSKLSLTSSKPLKLTTAETSATSTKLRIPTTKPSMFNFFSTNSKEPIVQIINDESRPTTIKDKYEEQLIEHISTTSNPDVFANTVFLIDTKTNTKIPIATREQLTSLLNAINQDGTTEAIKASSSNNVATTTYNKPITTTNQIETTTLRYMPVTQKIITTTENVITTSEKVVPVTEHESNEIDKLSVPDILDQLLLTSTNIYEINTELTKGNTGLKRQPESSTIYRESISTQTVPQTTTETIVISNNQSTEEQTTTTDNNLLYSIEQLLQQVAHDSPITFKSDEIVEHTETTTTNEDKYDQSSESDLINEAVGSLLSQVVNFNPNRFTSIQEMGTTTEEQDERSEFEEAAAKTEYELELTETTKVTETTTLMPLKSTENMLGATEKSDKQGVTRYDDEINKSEEVLKTEATSYGTTNIFKDVTPVVTEATTLFKEKETTSYKTQETTSFKEQETTTEELTSTSTTENVSNKPVKQPTIIAIVKKATTTTTIRPTTTLPSSTNAPLKPDLKKDDHNWSLVSTISPHNHTTTTGVTEANKFDIHSPTPVELVGSPQQGFGLEDSTSNLDPDISEFVGLCNELAFGFWDSVNNGISAARSFFVSPFAATSLLAMVFLGARGATSGEMNEILRLDDMVTFNPHLIFKNVSESIKDTESTGVASSVIIRELYSDRSKGNLLGFYKERARQFYDGHVEEISFREVGDIIRRRTNLLVRRQTGGKIPEYLRDSSIVAKSPLAGVSISIFQTDCSIASNEGRDGELYFVVLPSIRQRRLVPVPASVWRSGYLAGYEPGLDATAVAIGTADKTVSTIFVIPGQQGISAPGDGLARLEQHLIKSGFKEKTWSRLLKSLIPRPGLEVQIPRFSHKSVINASIALQQMGMKDLFRADKADLRGLNGVANDLYLSDILQINTFTTCGESIIGDTHHSEIYPATANRTYRHSRKIIKGKPNYDSELLEEPRDYQRAFHDPLHDPTLYTLPLPLRPRQARLPEVPRLRFDRPFLYFVRHNPTGLILHMGRFNPRLLP